MVDVGHLKKQVIFEEISPPGYPPRFPPSIPISLSWSHSHRRPWKARLLTYSKLLYPTRRIPGLDYGLAVVGTSQSSVGLAFSTGLGHLKPSRGLYSDPRCSVNPLRSGNWTKWVTPCSSPRLHWASQGSWTRVCLVHQTAFSINTWWVKQMTKTWISFPLS